MQKDYKASAGLVQVLPPKKRDVWAIRFLIGCAVTCMMIFVWWFVKPEHMGYGLIYWPLTFALFFKLLTMLHEWYHYWNVSVPEKPVLRTQYTADVFTTACPGEPCDMIIRTLKAMVAIKYPHTNYLCDEGDDPALKKVCEELGVIHVTRTKKIDAKAGNINHALEQATGDICVILDPDHVPIPEFLDRVLPYFEDPKVGYVQCVQAYSNQSESFIARGVAEQSYHFYGPMMMCMNTYGTVQAIGANCSFRRKALNDIGGHAAGLAEDMHTSMQLQAKGWKPLYIPEILTRGLVPETLSAYYKQQLKWSRGCFELLFRVYPGLFKKFTWRQRFHHFTMPLYFLFGLINFIDIMIPILALGLARVPWEVHLGDFALLFLPLCGFSILIRLFAQRWLLEKHERGLHLAGGMLRIATWWIFLVGFIYSIFNVKVPYIPTPKEDAHRDYWLLSVPNIIMAFICIGIIYYGLSIDWTPYSMAMAFFGVVNTLILGTIVLMSQQKFLLTIREAIKRVPVLDMIVAPLGTVPARVQQATYGMFGNKHVAIVTGMSLLFLSYNTVENKIDRLNVSKEKKIGGFYTGISLSEKNKNLSDLSFLENSLNTTFDVIRIKHNWSNDQECLPGKLMQGITARGAIPMISWEFYPENNTGEKIYASIYEGRQDNYLKQCAAMIRGYSEPVFISFNPGFDDPKKYLADEGNSAEEFVKAWQYLYTFFNNLGISNITWVWSPEYASSLSYYPGPKFVDWIGVSCLNYGEHEGDSDWCSFADMYTPFRNKLGAFQKPVMITEFGTAAGPDQPVWVDNAFKDIEEKFREIKSILICNEEKEFVIANKDSKDTTVYTVDFAFWKPVVAAFAENFQELPFSKKPLVKSDFRFLSVPHASYQSDFVKGTPGKYRLMVNGKPYYMRGIAYNTSHDWRDGHMPLTRRQVESDFERIKAMGANTIRRYDDGIYDRNILNISKEYDLNVLFGFWFDPKMDYYSDTVRMKEYMENVERVVLKYKDHPSIVAWSLGNETWGLLKHHYSKPYLTKVRNHYVKFIETMAQRIHKLDPTHPVISCMEYEIYQLAGELVAFRDGAPSLDVIGINSYYKQQIVQLNHVSYQFDSLRPYLVSEFGPRGYWDPVYNRISNGLLIEDSETEKANWYKEQWTKYVSDYKGFNIGGVAYCWHDRMEGSFTWFGLTDYRGRSKPSYYALKELWTKEASEVLPDFTIRGPGKFIAGQEYEFTAVPSSVSKEELEYDWYLYKDDYLEQLDNIDYSGDGSRVEVEIPDEPSQYRLYVFVTDGKGNVTTASLPMRVK